MADEPEHLLVYEYMPNKSFQHFLFTDAAERLSWRTRLLIMLGIASGLTYLHSTNINFRDLRSHVIFLDKDFTVKLGGFGLAKHGPETGETHVSTRVMGTYGYAAPEYITTGHLSLKCDIYSFGVVMLESILGRRAIDKNLPDGKQVLVDRASQVKLNRKKLKDIMDPRLEHNYPLKGALECITLALRCVANKPKDRPSSEEVLQRLQEIYDLH